MQPIGMYQVPGIPGDRSYVVLQSNIGLLISLSFLCRCFPTVVAHLLV